MLTFIHNYWFLVLPVAVIMLLKLLNTMRSNTGRADAAITVKAWAVSGVIWAFFPLLQIVMVAVGSVGHSAPAAAVAVVKPAAVAPAPAAVAPAVVKPAAVVETPAPAAAVAAVAPAAIAPVVAAPVVPAVVAPAPVAAIAPAPVVAPAPAVKVAAAPAAQTAPVRNKPSSEEAARKKSEAELDALNSKLGELLRK